jgi:peptidoglycan hydrolase-like protein with peptidoglycan-binding domain
MSGSPRDLAALDLWEASLNRSRARRSNGDRRDATASPHRDSAALGAAPARDRTSSLASKGAHSARVRLRATPELVSARDLAENELWELSLGRSRARRRAAGLRFVPTGSRAKRLSLGALVALSVGPASSLGEATAAQRQSPLAPPATPTSTEHTLLLEAGSTGKQVRKLQTALHIKVDGIYGPETEAAVYEYQATHGLHIDGIAGPATSGAIAKDAPAKKPSASDAVALVQAALGARVDGEFGPETYEAIRAFQASHRLNVDGVVGSQTWHALRLDGDQKLVPPASALATPEPAPTLASQAVEAGPGGAEAPQAASTEAVAHTAIVGDPGEGASAEAGAPAEEGAAEAPPAAESGSGTPEESTAGGAGEGGSASTVTNSGTGGGSEASSEATSAPTTTASGEAGGSGEGNSGEGEAGSGSEGSGAVRRVVGAANEIATRPYVYGGGHGSFQSEGYDCSGSVSYALHGGGLMKSPETSGEMESYGEPGPGKHITIYANSEHAYMEVNGRRYDTVALAEHGSRWSNSSGDDGGSFVERHPSGY